MSRFINAELKPDSDSDSEKEPDSEADSKSDTELICWLWKRFVYAYIFKGVIF